MTGSAIAVQTDVPQDFAQLYELAERLAVSNLVKPPLRRKPQDITLILLAARAMNLPIFWGLQSIDIVEGKPTIAAELMRARVRAAGHKLRVDTTIPGKVTVRIMLDGDDDWQEASYSVDDAKVAGLLTKSNWKNYQEDMLVARATARAVRRICPEVLFGAVYLPEEMGAKVDDEGRAVYNDGGVILDGEVVEGDPEPGNAPQPPAGPPTFVEHADRLAGAGFDNLKSVADYYQTLVKLGLHTEPFDWANEVTTLQSVWKGRLVGLATYVKDATDNPTIADLKVVWQVAKGTGVLDALPGHAVSVGAVIEATRVKLQEMVSAADVFAATESVNQAIANLNQAGIDTEKIGETE